MDKGNITITTNPGGARIYVDSVLMTDARGNPITTPVTLSLNEGYRYIVLEIEGYNKDFNRIYIYAGSNISLERNMTRLPYGQYMSSNRMQRWIKTYFMSESKQTPTTGTVVISTYPAGATIEMDGKTVIDMATREPLKTPVQLEVGMGEHNYVFRLAGYCNEFETVYIMPGTGATYISKNFSAC